MRDDIFELLNRHTLVSRETASKLSLYNDLLVKWQKSINLVSSTTINDGWNRHFLDSLQLLKYLDQPVTDNIVDIGTGAGFPGMVLAITGIPNIHLVESDAKKVTFLREVSRVTNCDVTIHHQRIEETNIKKCSLILSRALANLTSLLEYSSHLVSHETKCLFHKGKNWAMELEEAKKYFTFDHEIFPSVTDQDAVIVKLSHISRYAHATGKFPK